MFYFGSVSVRLWKKTRILFGMTLVRFSLKKKPRFGSNIIVIYYLCNSWVVNLQQILQLCGMNCAYQTLILQLMNCSTLIACHVVSLQLMQCMWSHFLSLLMYCTQFLSENRLNGCQILDCSVFKTEYEPILGFPHSPTCYTLYVE